MGSSGVDNANGHATHAHRDTHRGTWIGLLGKVGTGVKGKTGSENEDLASLGGRTLSRRPYRAATVTSRGDELLEMGLA